MNSWFASKLINWYKNELILLVTNRVECQTGSHASTHSITSVKLSWFSHSTPQRLESKCAKNSRYLFIYNIPASKANKSFLPLVNIFVWRCFFLLWFTLTNNLLLTLFIIAPYRFLMIPLLLLTTIGKKCKTKYVVLYILIHINLDDIRWYMYQNLLELCHSWFSTIILNGVIWHVNHPRHTRS